MSAALAALLRPFPNVYAISIYQDKQVSRMLRSTNVFCVLKGAGRWSANENACSPVTYLFSLEINVIISFSPTLVLFANLRSVRDSNDISYSTN